MNGFIQWFFMGTGMIVWLIIGISLISLLIKKIKKGRKVT